LGNLLGQKLKWGIYMGAEGILVGLYLKILSGSLEPF